jgi:hypothetical protein
MKTALAVIAVLALQIAGAPPARAQSVNRVLVAELRFGHDSTGTPTLELKKETVYFAEVVGRGTPLVKPVGSGRDAFIVPVEDGGQPPSYQIYPYHSGLYAVSLEDQDSTGIATLRLYRDVGETDRIQRQADDHGGIMGFVFALGAHTG